MEVSEARYQFTLMMSCPKCASAQTELCESRLCVNGTRRRRHQCKACGHRWTSWDGPRPTPHDVNRKRRTTPGPRVRPNLTPDEVRFALVNLDLNNRQVADQLGCSRETVRQLRCGLLYVKVHPELPRPKSPKPKAQATGPSCDRCASWKDDRCGFGFPDPVQEGLTFAADCGLYEEVSQSMSLA